MIGLSVINFVRGFFLFCAILVGGWLAYGAMTHSVDRTFVKTAIIMLVIFCFGAVLTTGVKRVYISMSARN